MSAVAAEFQPGAVQYGFHGLKGCRLAGEFGAKPVEDIASAQTGGGVSACGLLRRSRLAIAASLASASSSFLGLTDTINSSASHSLASCRRRVAARAARARRWLKRSASTTTRLFRAGAGATSPIWRHQRPLPAVPRGRGRDVAWLWVQDVDAGCSARARARLQQRFKPAPGYQCAGCCGAINPESPRFGRRLPRHSGPAC